MGCEVLCFQQFPDDPKAAGPLTSLRVQLLDHTKQTRRGGDGAPSSGFGDKTAWIDVNSGFEGFAKEAPPTSKKEKKTKTLKLTWDFIKRKFLLCVLNYEPSKKRDTNVFQELGGSSNGGHCGVFGIPQRELRDAEMGRDQGLPGWRLGLQGWGDPTGVLCLPGYRRPLMKGSPTPSSQPCPTSLHFGGGWTWSLNEGFFWHRKRMKA